MVIILSGMDENGNTKELRITNILNFRQSSITPHWSEFDCIGEIFEVFYENEEGRYELEIHLLKNGMIIQSVEKDDEDVYKILFYKNGKIIIENT